MRNRECVGLVGFGGFGQLIAKHLAPHADLRVCDPGIAAAELPEGGVFPLVPLREIASCDIIILAVPVAAMRSSCEALAPHLRPGALVLDVGSVKLMPVADMVECLPDHVEILGTHPLFGPQSSQNGVQGRKITLCPVRGERWRALRVFLARALGLQVILSTAEAHDREAAMTQGLTHLIAQVLTQMGPLPKTQTTASFDLLAQAVGMVRDDPPEVLEAIERSNPFAAEVRSAFFERAEGLRQRFERP